jgi:hypothetical protein
VLTIVLLLLVCLFAQSVIVIVHRSGHIQLQKMKKRSNNNADNDNDGKNVYQNSNAINADHIDDNK